MAQKPTSLAAQLADSARKEELADAKEDTQVSERDTPEGKVWVRLQNAHYDSEGVYHASRSIVLLDASAVPSSAKVLTKAQADAAIADAAE